jgi:hypothetical protein
MKLGVSGLLLALCLLSTRLGAQEVVLAGGLLGMHSTKSLVTIRYVPPSSRFSLDVSRGHVVEKGCIERIPRCTESISTAVSVAAAYPFWRSSTSGPGVYLLGLGGGYLGESGGSSATDWLVGTVAAMNIGAELPFAENKAHVMVEAGVRAHGTHLGWTTQIGVRLPL